LQVTKWRWQLGAMQPVQDVLVMSPQEHLPRQVLSEASVRSQVLPQIGAAPAGDHPGGLQLHLREPPCVPFCNSAGLDAFDGVFNGFLSEPINVLAAAEGRLVVAEGSGDTLASAAALLAVADATCSLERPDEALQKAQLALSRVKDLKEMLGEAAALHVLAKAHFVNKDYAEAVVVGDKALSLFRAQGHRTGEAMSLNALAEASLQSDAAQALRFALEGHELLQQLGDLRRAAIVQRTVIGAHIALGDNAGALAAAKDSLLACRKRGDRKDEASLLIVLAEIYNLTGQTELAARAATSASMIFKHLEDRRNAAVSAHLVAAALLEDKKPTEALSWAREASVLFGTLSDRDQELASKRHAILALIDMGDADQALCEAKEVVEVCREHNRRFLPQALRDLAAAHLASNAPDLGQLAAEEASVICREAGDDCGEVTSLEVVMQSYVAMQEAKKSIQTAYKIAALFRRSGSQRKEAVMLHDIARAEIKRRRPAQAKEAANAALKLYHSSGDLQRAGQMQEISEYAEYMQQTLKTAAQEAEMMVNDYKRSGDPRALYAAALSCYRTRRGLQI